MKITLDRAVAQITLQQAIETCDTKAKGEPESEFFFSLKIDDPDNLGSAILTVTSFNDRAEQVIRLPAAIMEGVNGEGFTVTAASLLDFVKQFSSSEFNMGYSAEANTVIVGSKKTKAAFPTGDPEDFVAIVTNSPNKPVLVDGSLFASALKYTAFAAATDYTLAPITAVCVRLAKDKLTAQATDKYRISSYSVDAENRASDGFEVLLPRANAEKLAKLLDGVSEVEIVQCARHVIFRWNDTVFTSSIENGIGKPFPDTNRFLAGVEVAKAKISRAELLSSLKLASLFARDSYIGVALVEEGLKVTTHERESAMSSDIRVTQEQEGQGEVMIGCGYILKAVEKMSDPWLVITLRQLNEDILSLVLSEGSFDHLIFPVDPKQHAEETEDGDSAEVEE